MAVEMFKGHDYNLKIPHLSHMHEILGDFCGESGDT